MGGTQGTRGFVCCTRRISRRNWRSRPSNGRSKKRTVRGFAAKEAERQMMMAKIKAKFRADYKVRRAAERDGKVEAPPRQAITP